MALDVKELCRLCGKKYEFSKDLKDEDNKNILKMIQEFIQIPFAEHDELPTKVCLNCEEKIESFQLFVLECYNVQETLRQMCLEACEKYPIKLEDDIVIDFNISAIKSEVKHELPAEDLAYPINSGECMTGFDADDYNNLNDDNVTLATLKDLKQKQTSARERMTLTETENKHLKEISDLNTGDFVNCDKCPRITKTPSVMNEHKMRHIPKSERKFCCSSCDKIFTYKNRLREHLRSHLPLEERKIYSCGLCKQKFTTRSKAASHKRLVHDKIMNYKCDLCAYACGSRSVLRRHRDTHSDDQPFACRKCDKRFKVYWSLRAHEKTHEDTSYACPVCSRVLKTRRTLREHLIVHDDNRRHVCCPHCNMAFKRRQTLKEHLHTHTGDKPLACKWCDVRFSHASTLRSHRLHHHPDKMAEVQPEGYLKNDAVPPETDVEAI